MNEKMQKLEQEKRKLEEALARNKEAIRKQRTHRLGAILEKAYPPAKDISEGYAVWQTKPDIRAMEQRGAVNAISQGLGKIRQSRFGYLRGR